MNANPSTAAMQPAPGNRLATFGKFWQGMTSSQQEDPSSQDPPAKLTPRPSTVSSPFIHSLCFMLPLPWLCITCISGCVSAYMMAVYGCTSDRVQCIVEMLEPSLVNTISQVWCHKRADLGTLLVYTMC